MPIVASLCLCRLNKFWSNQNMVYDYKSDIAGIENRSLISLDDTSA